MKYIMNYTTNQLILLMLKKGDLMPEELIKKYFSKPQFINKKYPIFEYECEDEGCKLNGNFDRYIILNGDNISRLSGLNEKSVDRIIFLKKAQDMKVDVILCELTLGEKKYTTVVEKIKKSGEYILTILEELGFRIRDFKCIFIGKYKNPKRVIEKPFSIPKFHRNDIIIKKLSCGDNFPEIRQ